MFLGRVDARNGRIIVDVTLIGRRITFPAQFLLDTGSMVTVVDGTLIDAIDYSVREGRRESRLLGPGDSRSYGYVLTIAGLEIGGVRHDDFDVHVHDMPVEDGIIGLLGMDWLLRHVVTLDGPAGRIELLR